MDDMVDTLISEYAGGYTGLYLYTNKKRTAWIVQSAYGDEYNYDHAPTQSALDAIAEEQLTAYAY